MLEYSKYPLSRIISVYQIVSADYVSGGLVDEAHIHQDALELIYCMAGTCQVFRDRAAMTISEGDVMLISPGTSHYVSFEDPDTQIFVVAFGCDSEYLKILYNAQFKATGQQKEMFSLIMKELRTAFRLTRGALRLIRFQPNSKSPVGAEQLICCYLEQIMISFLREVTSENGRVVETRHFSRAIRQYMTGQISAYVREHLCEKLTVSDLAREFHYSRARLSTLYKAATGTGLNDFITQERIALAKTLLEEGTRSVTEVSEKAGFSSPEYFSRRFRQCTGMSPSEWAENMKQ